MNKKTETIISINTSANLYDYVAREFANVEPDGDLPLVSDSLDDWNPLEDRQELDAMLLEQYQSRLAD